MASTSERSFGARLRHAQDLTAYLSGFVNYNPPRPEETIDSVNTLISNMVAANSEETVVQQTYNGFVTNRYETFRTNDLSLFKILSPIRNSVVAQYGKDSVQYKQIDTIIGKIRSKKLNKVINAENYTEAKVSQSEQSYGSSTQFFSDLVNTLSTFPNYNPTRPELKVAQLQVFLASLTDLNNSVAVNYQKLKAAKTVRREFYIDLAARGTRIKAYVKANYGASSSEYGLIKNLVL